MKFAKTSSERKVQSTINLHLKRLQWSGQVNLYFKRDSIGDSIVNQDVDVQPSDTSPNAILNE